MSFNIDVYQMMEAEEALKLGAIVDSMEWKRGMARTEEATDAIKFNLEIKPQDSEEARGLSQQLGNQLAKVINKDHFPKKIFAFKFNKYTSDGNYKRHGDSAFMGGAVRTDLACTLSLSDPNTYKGGDLCIESPDGRNYHKVRLGPGQAVVYDCYRPHWVTPVTEGSRISAICWIESMFRDGEQREFLRRFGDVVRSMELYDGSKQAKDYTTLGTLQGKLFRMWGDYE